MKYKRYLYTFSILLISLIAFTAIAQNGEKTLLFCGDSEFAPYSFISEDGKPEGFSVDLARVLSATINRDIQIDLVPTNECLKKLRNGEIDGLIGAPHRKKDESDSVVYSTSITEVEYAIFVETRNTYVNSIKSLDGTVVGMNELSPIVPEIEKNKRITLIKTPTVLDSLNMLRNREVAAVIASKNVALYYIQERNLEGIKIVGSPIGTPYPYSVAVRKDNVLLLKEINAGLEILENNETVNKLKRKWFGLRLIQPFPWRMVIVLSSGITILMLILGAILWVISLNATVKAKTRQIQIMTQTMVEKDKLAVLGKLAGQIAHELRTPLSIINNSAYLLRKEGAKDRKLFEKRLNVLEEKIKLSSNILESILSYSRVKAEAATKIIVKNCVDQVVKDLSIPPGIKVKKKIKEQDEYLAIFMDFHQLYSVIRNLLINGAQAMKDKGTLTVETFSSDKGSMVNIRVCDTGQGVVENAKNKIFNLFYSTKITGTGLGLPISKSIIEANQGELILEKTGEKGTCFLIKVPAAKY